MLKEYKLLIFWTLLVFVLWIGNYFVVSSNFDDGNITTKTTTKITQISTGRDKQIKTETVTIKDSEKDNGRGTFGDMFGAINALFTGLGFSGLLFTIHLQSKQSEEQRLQFQEQLNLQKKQFKDDLGNRTHQFNLQKNQFQEQLDEQRKQFLKVSFDNKFFKLLEFYQESLESFTFSYTEENDESENEIKLTSLEACEKINERFYSEFYSISFNIKVYDEKSMKNIFIKVFNYNHEAINHLTINFVHLILFITDSKNFTKEEKEIEYISILKTKITQVEMLLLSYYFICIKVTDNFNTLLDDYRVFERILLDKNAEKQTLQYFYKHLY